MNYSDIHTFLTIVSCESLSQAADSLFVSQPALSHRLNQLEKELGASLVTRSKGVRSIELTTAGKRFLPIAKKWMQLWEETEQIDFAKPAVALRLATVDSLTVFFMPQVCSHFVAQNPDCRFQITTLHSNAAYQAIENNEIDLAFITNPHFFKKVQTIPLFREEMTFLCSKDASYQDGMMPSDLNVEHEIYTPWSNTFLQWHNYWFGSKAEAKVKLDNMALLGEMLKIKKTWCVVPSTVAQVLHRQDSFHSIQLKGRPEPRTCYAIINDQRQMNQYVVEFIEELLNAVRTFPEVEILEQMK